MSAPRWRIVLRGIGLGLVPLLGLLAWARLPDTYESCRAYLDAQLRTTNPHLLALIATDAKLRDELDEKTRMAFNNGGSAAGTQMFWNIVNYRLLGTAGDDAIRACHNAWTQAFTNLSSQPHVCRLFSDRNMTALPPRTADRELAGVNAACDLAMQDGAARRDNPPPLVYGNDFQAISDRASAGPEAPTAADHAAWYDAAHATDQAVCDATIKFSRNVEALPPALGATYMRSQYASSGNFKFVKIEPPPPDPPAPESDLHCAAAGTRFVLSNFLRSGRANTWTSLGRRGFDCAINSAATGQRGLFDTLLADLTPTDDPNRMRLLWPLAPGKSVSIHFAPVNDDAYDERVTVLGKSRYWLPWGWVNAFEIQRDIRQGAQHYIILDYWSNDLGFQIGRHSYAISGSLPDSVGVDFQLVAILAPGGPS